MVIIKIKSRPLWVGLILSGDVGIDRVCDSERQDDDRDCAEDEVFQD
jgi:hypothetical protein